MAANLDLEWEKGRDRLSEPLRALLARGREVKAIDYQKALARIAVLNQGFEELFSRYDAVLTPSAPGTAPEGLAATGDPAFCTLWSLCGTPALNLPLMRGENGLPLGVQLAAARHDDARLLRTARWLVGRLQAG
jgi:Asp-tRNA(Asn)/Glu-tRNA(Gln) amidotransferase A subunit family amidase